MIAEVRDELRESLRLAEAGDMAGVIRMLNQTLADLADTRLLTMPQAAAVLGLKAPDALAAVMRVNGVPLERCEGKFLVPLSEVERVADSEWVREMRELDRLHDLSSDLGSEMTQEEMDALEAGRPGRLPWETERERAGQSV